MVDMGYLLIIFIAMMLLWLFTSKGGKHSTKIKTTGNEANSYGYQKKTKPPKDMAIYDSVRFQYRDFNGDMTERTVDVVSGKRGEEFKGYCHFRNDIRTFYFSRIEGDEVINVATGEIMTPMAWRNKLQGTSVSREALEDESIRIEHKKSLAEANSTWLSLTMPPPIVIFENKRFALGGYFDSGNIEESKEKVTKRGGIIQTVPNGKTDYIVVNPNVGVNETYKNAIQKLHERNINPVIVSEKHFLAHL